ncbi:hypothetical protein QIU19_10505 [Capnocytophaga canimorsus]|nr:hypothetical protein [Capnocytophaga canimorsus]WGU67850.1 hypothetical protein QIU19_10505 [Capnocytophaga canimorsus]
MRTFHNHREAIAQMFDIDIECDTRNGYKYYISNITDIKQNTLQNWLLNSFTVGNLLQEQKKPTSSYLARKCAFRTRIFGANR